MTLEDEMVEALQAWITYYEGHSTKGNRDIAYGKTREVLIRYFYRQVEDH